MRCFQLDLYKSIGRELGGQLAGMQLDDSLLKASAAAHFRALRCVPLAVLLGVRTLPHIQSIYFLKVEI